MQTSCISHPKGARYVTAYEWQLKVCGGNECAAKLINFFAFHHDRILTSIEQWKTINAARRAAGKEAFFDLSGWQFHKIEYIENGLLGTYKRDAIYTGIKILVRLGFLEENAPEELRQRYRVGRVGGYRFRSDVVSAYLDKIKAEAAKAAKAPPVPPEPAKPKTRAKAAELLDRMKDVEPGVLDAARDVFRDWKTVHYHPTAIETPERLRYIVKLLLRGYTPERLKIASRGCLLDDWYQGANDRRKVWDKISIIFENGEKVEEFEATARAKGVTEANLNNYRKKPPSQRPLDDKPEWQRAIDNCILCDEKGWRALENGEPTKCSHPAQTGK